MGRPKKIEVKVGTPNMLKELMSQVSNAERCEIRKAARNLWKLWRMHYRCLYGEELPSNLEAFRRSDYETYYTRMSEVADHCAFDGTKSEVWEDEDKEVSWRGVAGVVTCREDAIKAIIRALAIQTPSLGNAY